MKKTNFLELVKSGTPILLDGAMGTELYNRGIFINRCFEEVNLNSPQLVSQLHKEYKKAGAMALSTNSWGANRLKLKAYNLDDKLYEINFQAAKLAKEVAEGELYVMGSVGPLGVRIEPFGPTSYSEARNYFKEQITALVEGGVDIISLETFDDLSEIKEAIYAAKEVNPQICVMAHVIMTPEGNLPYGTPIPWVMEQLEKWDADIIGLNCSVGPQPMLTVVEKIRPKLTKPLVVQPNAGLPRLVEGRNIYMSTPEYLAHFAQAFFQSGVQIIGGCCGTSPDHIRAMASTLRQAKAFGQAEKLGSKIHLENQNNSKEPIALGTKRVEFAQKSLWSQKIANGQRVFSVELLPPSGIDPSKIVEKSAILKRAGIDAINIPDGPRASARMSAILTAVMIEQQAKIETVLHYTCRDRNLLGMQSDMLGAHAIGLRNMLLITGDPPKLGSYPNATGVFDVDAIGLTNMVYRLNGGLDLGNRPIGQPCELSIGVGVNPVHRDFSYEMKRFAWKVDAGAEWAITQPVFDLQSLFKFLDYINKHNLVIPIIAGIWPLTSYRNALFMNNEVPGVVIPAEIMEKMAKPSNPEDARKVGIEIAHNMIEKLGTNVSGIQISAPFGRVDLALAVIGKDEPTN